MFDAMARRCRFLVRCMAVGGSVLMLGWWPRHAAAVPLFARQTGQQCVACHAGGQFPELTTYGRVFKLTGYTLGERTVPLAAMAVASMSKVANTGKSADPAADFSKNDRLLLATASLFAGGKITDHLGAFAQVTYDPYAVQATDGSYRGHSNADNIDIRYADSLVDASRDWIFGVSLNNNPSVSDPWNTAAAWMQYVPVPSPSSSRFIDGTTPYPGFGAGGNVAGLTAYGFWNRSLYAEFGLYGTASGPFSFMRAGVAPADRTALRGLNPYGRLAWNHDDGAHSWMVGAAAMAARVYDDPQDTTDPASTHRYRDLNLDAQYQYLTGLHAATAQFVYGRRWHRYPAAQAGQPAAFVDAAGNALAPTNAQDTMRLLRLRGSYVHAARYGVGASAFDLGGSTNTALQTSGFDPGTLTITSDPSAQAASTPVGGNLSGNPGTRGWTLETLWLPAQYLRVGLQYTAYLKFNGAARNYDGFGRNASDNNSLFFYVWGAY